MYRIRSTGEVVSQGEFRSRNKGTSFPKVWTPELVDELGLDPVFETPAPTVTRYQTAFKNGVEQVAGKWVWKWAVSDMNDEAKAAKDAEAAKAVRAQRDRLIAETDWIVIKNLELNQNVPGIWEVYRQNLRDVPAQAGFPHDITWPVKP
jgi:hypothetical protein